MYEWIFACTHTFWLLTRYKKMHEYVTAYKLYVSAFALHIIGLHYCVRCKRVQNKQPLLPGSPRVPASPWCPGSPGSPGGPAGPGGPLKPLSPWGPCTPACGDTTSVKQQLGVIWNEAHWSKKSTGVGLMDQPQNQMRLPDWSF